MKSILALLFLGVLFSCQEAVEPEAVPEEVAGSALEITEVAETELEIMIECQIEVEEIIFEEIIEEIEIPTDQEISEEILIELDVELDQSEIVEIVEEIRQN